MIPARKWSRDRKWSLNWTANDPTGTVVIPKLYRKWSPDRKWSPRHKGWKCVLRNWSVDSKLYNLFFFLMIQQLSKMYSICTIQPKPPKRERKPTLQKYTENNRHLLEGNSSTTWELPFIPLSLKLFCHNIPLFSFQHSLPCHYPLHRKYWETKRMQAQGQRANSTAPFSSCKDLNSQSRGDLQRMLLAVTIHTRRS